MMPTDNPDPLLRDYLQKSRNLQKQAWLFTLVPVVIFVGVMVYGTIHLRGLLGQVDDADKALTIKKKEFNQIDAQLRSAKTSVKICGLAIGDISASPEQAQNAFKSAASQFADVALITIQVADKSQLAKAGRIAAHLRTVGYEVPPDTAIDIRGRHIAKGTYLRYFYESDKALANQILQEINSMGAKAQLYDLSHANDLGETHPKQFEFRLGLNDIPRDARPVQTPTP